MHTWSTRAMVCRYSSHPPVLTLLLLLLLCCTVGCPATVPHHSMHGEISRKNMQTAVVRELPRKGEGAVQAYTVSAPTAGSGDSKDNKNWAPIHIKAYTRDLNDPSKYCTGAGRYSDTPSYNWQYCRESSVLTVRKKKILEEWSIPAAIKLHTDRLRVQPAEGTVKLKREEFLSGQCLWYNIPEEHFTKGLSDADMHIYVSAAPFNGYSYTWFCRRLENHRPIAAAINMEPMTIAATDSHIRTVAHEIGHSLGFDGDTFARLKMSSSSENVRDKPYVLRITTNKSKETAQKYYNCNTTLGLELEDDGAAAASHFEMRNIKDELMSPVPSVGGAPVSYSALTLSVFDDMPFYTANFSMAEPLRWANNSGCDFLEKKCMENRTTKYPMMFCSTTMRLEGYLQCTYDRMGLGECLTKRYPKGLEPQYQYLGNAYQGGIQVHMDYCPYVEKVRHGGCTDGKHMTIFGSFIGPDARCVKGKGLEYKKKPIGDVCVNTSCKDGKLSVQFQGDKDWYPCEEGKEVELKNANWSGSVICPKYDDVCTRYPDITNKEPLPEVTADDDKPAPANITWPIIKREVPSPESAQWPTSITDVRGDSSLKETVRRHTSEDTGAYGSITQTIRTGTTHGERMGIPDPHNHHDNTALDTREAQSVNVESNHVGAEPSHPERVGRKKPDEVQKAPLSHGGSTQSATTNNNMVQDSVTMNNLATNGKVRGAHALNNSDAIALNIGIGDGGIPAAGHASLLLLVIASAVAVVFSL